MANTNGIHTTFVTKNIPTDEVNAPRFKRGMGNVCVARRACKRSRSCRQVIKVYVIKTPARVECPEGKDRKAFSGAEQKE